MNDLNRQVAERIGDWVYRTGNAGPGWYPDDSVGSSERRDTPPPYDSCPAWWGPLLLELVQRGCTFYVNGYGAFQLDLPGQLPCVTDHDPGEAVCRAWLEMTND